MKKSISILLVICTLFICLTSCGMVVDAGDEELAVDRAKEEAKQYYFDHIDGTSVGAGVYSTYNVSVKSMTLSTKAFSAPQYKFVIELSFGAKGADPEKPDVTVWSSLDIEYTMEVKNGIVDIINTEVLTD